MAGIDDNLRKVPPQNLDAESSVLGGILLENEAVNQVLELLRPEDFYRESHRKVFRAMIELSDRSEPVDLITLSDCLKSRGELEAVGGTAYLASLADFVPTAANISHYARIVREKSILRSLISTATEIATRGYEEQGSVEEFLDSAEKVIFDISEKKIKASFVAVGDMIKDTLKTVEKLYERKEMVTGVPTGYDDLDKLTAGLQPAELIIVAGRPGMGKTSFALNIAANAAFTGAGVAVFSLEMAKEQLVLRMLCSEARVNSSKVRSGYLGERDFPQLAKAAGRLHEAPIYIDDTPAISVLELRAKARRLVRDRSKKIGLIVVDYLQLMRGMGAASNREQEISEISRSLKALAKELNVPVIALSQLNRRVEDRGDRRPMMSDLRESGAIEQDSDVIMFIYRDEVYNKSDESKKGLAEIIVAKQRNGPIDTVTLTFLNEYTRFENYTERDELEYSYDEAEEGA
ncbi:MAG: replicative DNA helicase [Deltaproteobacteria bacterium]|nr:replicative DNA helicase [Deltaproteobacteria bacterium]MBI2365820.1 replicative DNA helicase [Deltaproteobacteria bacterium]MBI3063434.1 replicative DNA helicase [Deltaproteobacteria bacterium]